MKWMIASDIHGSEIYCKQMLEAFEREQCERLILLGDLLYHGPRNNLPTEYQPKSVIELLNEYRDRIFCVRGNCDSEVDQMVLDFPIMADYTLMPLEDRCLFITHGHLYNEQHLPPHKLGDILLMGHTHVPMCKELDTCLIMNPGSISIPKGGSDHSFMILEDQRVFTWKTLAGETFMQHELTTVI